MSQRGHRMAKRTVKGPSFRHWWSVLGMGMVNRKDLEHLRSILESR